MFSRSIYGFPILSRRIVLRHTWSFKAGNEIIRDQSRAVLWRFEYTLFNRDEDRFTGKGILGYPASTDREQVCVER